MSDENKGIIPLNEKPVSASAALADFFVTVIGGKVRLATVKTIADCLTDAQIKSIEEAAKELTAILTKDAQDAADRAEAVATRLETFLGSIPVDVKYDPLTYLLTLMNENSLPIGQGTTIKAGISDIQMVVEKNEETGTNDLVLYDGDGEVVSRTPLPAGGGGGGGGASSYSISIKNLMDSRTVSAPAGAAIPLTFLYTSVDEDGYDDGKGVGTIWVNGVKKGAVDIVQGENTVYVESYIGSGANAVKITVENSEGSSRSLSYTVNIVALSVTTTLDAYNECRGDTIFYYTPIGTGVKTIHFLMDGKELGTAEVSTSGRSQSYTIPAQEHGAHIFKCYAEMTVSGVTVTSDPIILGMAWIDSEKSTPMVVSTFDVKEATQGEALTISYLAYDPATEETTVTRSIIDADGNIVESKAVSADRTEQKWVVQDYPAGAIKFRVAIGAIGVDLPVNVKENSIVIEPITDSLVLDFDPIGRSNKEDNPENWTSGEVSATFSGVGFSDADGWLTDADGAAMFRLLPGGQMTIPFHLFATDCRDTGATVEVEMATHNVRDYDSVVMSCLSGNRGFMIASQYAELHSEQSSISKQFKEDKKVRVSFVVEPRNLHRMIYVYVDSVMCGAIQYPADDNFAQSPATGITIGAESSGIDVYHIRLYRKGLTRFEILDNFAADRPTLKERIDAHKRNDIFNESEEVVITKLPVTLPYMIISCPELPQSKGDKKTCEITYVDPANPAKSFTASGVTIDVQGTSSAGYKKKNWKITYKNGLTLTASGEQVSEYQLRSTSVPASCFCMKADVASSEGANNVELVRLYNDTVPHKTPPQEENANVRVGIDGLPCVIFWQNSSTGELRFWGKYNFNDEKSSTQVYGLTEGCESWEIKNNTSNRVIFKSADFSGSGWLNDFEARYPDGNEDPSKLKVMCEWVVSTDRAAATGNSLGKTVTYGGVSYTNDTAEYRLAKFKAEFEEHFVKVPMLYYYLFTETFLMVDNRAKNFFPSTFDGVHWLPLPYDMDTAMGINNEGQLVFEYDLEDTDTVGGADVFNGQSSVLWCNIRDAFPDELKALYGELRGGSMFNYSEVVNRWASHQATWPEAIWNEDAWEKYLEPLENDNDSGYLAMLQGDKKSQREWWVFNGFRYRDSKYECGDAEASYITLRCYAVGDITITPYSHIWSRIKFGSYTVKARSKRNQAVTLKCPLDEMNDTETYIYSSDRLAKIGDLSHLHVGYANFVMAPKLQVLKLGDGAADYQNTRLNELYVGNNDLLDELDVRNCVNLKMPVDLTGCVGIETIRATGTAIDSVKLPVGGKLKTLELPGTVTNLTIRDHAQLSSFTMEGYGEIQTLRIENTPNIPWEALINGAEKLNRVRIIGAEWTASSAEALQETYDRLSAAAGMNAAGDNTDKAVVTGRVVLKSDIDADLLAAFTENFPDLLIVANGIANCTVRFRNWDGTVLHTTTVAYGSDVADPVANGTIDAPVRAASDRVVYVFKGWDRDLTNITNNAVFTAVFEEQYAWIVTFCNWDGSELCKVSVQNGGAAADPIESGLISTPARPGDADYAYTFLGWDKSIYNVTEDRTITARYSTEASVAVSFVDWDGTVLYTAYCAAGSSIADPILAGHITAPVRATDESAQKEYTFTGWDKELSNITEATTVTATYSSKSYYTATFQNPDGTVLFVRRLYAGNAVKDPVATGEIETPTQEPTETYGYIYKGWDKTLTSSISANVVYTATYKTDQQFTVTFVDYDGTVLDTQLVYDEDGAVDPVTSGRIATPVRASTAQYEYKWTGWSGTFTNITADKTITATYSTTTRTYTVTFWNGSTLVQTVANVAYGGSATYTGDPVSKPDVDDPDSYVHVGWTPSPTSITGDTACYAVYVALPEGFSDAYGVLWAYGQSSTALGRLGLAKTFVNPIPATSLTDEGSSPFDDVMPWAGMKKYNIIDGAIAYSEDDEGFSMTDYDTVVYIPEFWFKAAKDTSAETWVWAISPTEKEGFTKHPGSGRYIGRYHTSGDSSAVFSKSGVAPLVNTSRTNFRTYSHNKGDKWWMLDIATWSALQMLYLIEFADFHSQNTLGKGYGSSSQVSGASDGAVYHTVNGGNTYNQYRWVEQPFGRVMDWVDGFMASSRKCYLGTDNATFADSTSALTAAGVTLPSSNYITGFGYSEEFPWAFLPDEASGGSASTFVPDYVYSFSGINALYVGGNYYSLDLYGFWYFYANNSATNTYGSLGSRLLYIP